MTPASVPASVTVAVTSCGRLNLLLRTLGSFRRHNREARLVISEDSADPAVAAAVRSAVPDAEVLWEPVRRGLMGSIDRLYARIETDFIFHLEDDWDFSGPVDWTSALSLLSRREDISQVCVRAASEIKPKWMAQSSSLHWAERRYSLMSPTAHPEFFGWSSNPGLIRRELYRRYAPFGRYRHDELSGIVKAGGQTMAFQLPGVARHIGQGRTVTDPTGPARPRSRILKLVGKVKQDLYYAGLRRSPV